MIDKMRSFLSLHKDDWTAGFQMTLALLFICVFLGAPLWILTILDIFVEGLVAIALLALIIYIFGLISKHQNRRLK